MRKIGLLALLVFLLSASVLRAEDDQLVSILVVKDDGPGRRVPVPGARVACYTEDTLPTSVHSRLVAQTVADENGVAELRVDSDRDYHWLIDAKGFGTVHEYGTPFVFDPGTVIVLPPGTDRPIRVLGPFGEPVAGARVELTYGCSHSPAARVVTTNEQGLATIEDVFDWGWDLWITASGIDLGPYSLEAAPPGRPAVVFTEFGFTATGLVLDVRGDPVAGAVVRELDGFRGPVTTTDERGEFKLHGLSGKASLGVYRPDSPFHPRPDAVVRAFTEGVRLRVRLADDRPVSHGDREPRHRLDLDLKGADSLVPIRAVRLEDGTTVTGNSGLWPASFDLPAGHWRITCGGGFSFESPVTAETVVPRPDHSPLSFVLDVGQGAFAIRPTAAPLPKKGQLLLPGFEKEIRTDAIEWVPRTGPLALVLEEPYFRVIPLPDAEEDHRFLVFPPARENQVRFTLTDPSGEEILPEVELEDGSVVHPRTDGDGGLAFSLARVGETLLRFSSSGHLGREVPLVLPYPPGEVDLGRIVLHPESDLVTRTFTVVEADGAPVPEFEVRTVEENADLFAAESEGESGFECELAVPVPAVIHADGHLPLPVSLTPDGPVEFRFPGGKLRIQTRGPRGEPVEATVTVDGHPFEVEDGLLVVTGVPGGTHVVIFYVAGRPAIARELAVPEGETVPVRLQFE